MNIHPKRFLLGQTLHCNKSFQITTDSSRRLAVLHKRRGIPLSFLLMLLALTIRYLESIVHVFLSPWNVSPVLKRLWQLGTRSREQMLTRQRIHFWKIHSLRILFGRVHFGESTSHRWREQMSTHSRNPTNPTSAENIFRQPFQSQLQHNPFKLFDLKAWYWHFLSHLVSFLANIWTPLPISSTT